MKRLLACLCALIACTNLHAHDLRILDLLPGLLCPLAVEPAIPENFVPLSERGELNVYDWIYWGPEDVVKAAFQDRDVTEPVIRVKITANVAQRGPKLDTKDVKSMNLSKQKDLKEPGYYETEWGNYPVQAAKVVLGGRATYLAWVGLNDPESGSVLLFNLVYPLSKNEPDNNQIWEDLITKTTLLKEGDFFKACGQDLQEGYTLLNTAGAKLKMIAEKREYDGKLQVVVIPEDSSTKFRYVGMEEGQMGAEWKFGEPMVKVFGEITAKKGNWTNVINEVTSIFYKTVPEFTYNKDEDTKSLIFQKPT